MKMKNDLKVVLLLWDGVRFDAINKIDSWIGLPNIKKLINNGVLYSNVFSFSPALTPTAVGSIVKIGVNGYSKWISTTLHEETNGHVKTCFVGYPENGIRMKSYSIPHCTFIDNITYDKKEEFRRLNGTPAERASMKFHRIQYPDKLRMDVGCKMIPHYDFTFIYFVEPDDKGHICRDQRRWIYDWGSPYIWAIKNCDNLLYHIIKTLEWCAKDNYVIIIVADHGMTDQGSHALAQWNDERVSRVPLVVYGKNIREGWVENKLHRTFDIPSGIVGLFKNKTKETIFKNAIN